MASSVVSEYAHSPTGIVLKANMLRVSRKAMDAIIGKMVLGVKAIIQTVYVKVQRLFSYRVIVGFMKETWRTIGSQVT